MLPIQNPIINQNIPIEINCGNVYKSISLIFVLVYPSIIYLIRAVQINTPVTTICQNIQCMYGVIASNISNSSLLIFVLVLIEATEYPLVITFYLI